MKRFILSLIAAVATIACVKAQEYAPLRWEGLYTNRFWDNWEVAAAGGISSLQIHYKDGGKRGDFADHINWNANIAVSKWFVPTLGARLQVDAGELNGFSRGVVRESLTTKLKMPYLYVHGDILLNMSNWIGGYDPDRFYSAISYMGFGYMAISENSDAGSPHNNEYAFTTGVINKFRITPRLDIELDIRSWLFAESALPKSVQGGSRIAVAMTASVGLAYRFNMRSWSPAYSQLDVDGYLLAIMTLEETLLQRDAELKRIGGNLSTLKHDNEMLRQELAAKPQSVVEKPTVVAQSVVFFEIGSAELSDYAKATLEQYITSVGDSDNDIVITGYADKETGSAERNMKLSKERAECVTAHLIEGGVAKERITTTWVGDTEQAFTSPDTAVVNRCVIIK